MMIKGNKQTTRFTTMLHRIAIHYSGFRSPLSERKVLLITGDAIVILLTVSAAFLLWQYTSGRYFDADHIRQRWYWFPVIMGGWFVLAWLNDLYDIQSSISIALTAMRVLITDALALVIYIVGFFLWPTPDDLPRLFIIYFLILVLPTTILWRWLYVSLSRLLPVPFRVLIVGGDIQAAVISKILQRASGLNYKLMGYVEEDTAVQAGANIGQLIRVGKITDLPKLVTRLEIKEVVIAIERSIDKNLIELLIECHRRGAQVSYMPDLYEKLKQSIPIEHIDPLWVLAVMENLPTRLQLLTKRLVDLALSFMGLQVFIVLLPFIAAAIRLESSGPIFYTQTRCGRGKKPFKIIKFRTMTVNAEQDGVARWATQNDVRITRVGRILRKTRLDELPQVINILKGEMSIVGPRPERPELVAELKQQIPFYQTRMMVKPGLTGWAQVHYDYGNSVDDALIKLQYDFYYLRYWSLWLDLYTIFRTFSVVLQFKGM